LRRTLSLRPLLEALEDRATPATLHVGSAEPYHTIQSAVNAAHPNDTILVDPGTYQEQVIILPKQNGITLQASYPNKSGTTSSQYSTIVAPTTLPDVLGVVIVKGALNVKINGFVIEGQAVEPMTPGPSGGQQVDSGILIDNGGSATITGNYITQIHDSQFSTAQHGVGIAVGATFTHNNTGVFQTGSADIEGNTIDEFQKGGVFIDVVNSFAKVFNNTITGIGPNPFFYQFGVEVSNLGGADIEGNTISDLQYSPYGPSVTGPLSRGTCVDVTTFTAGFGIALASTAGSRPGQLVVSNNYITCCDEGIRAANVRFAVISSNHVYFNNFDGIDLFNFYLGRVNGNSAGFNGGDGIALSGNSFSNVLNANNDAFWCCGYAGNGGDGIFLDTTAHDNAVTGNTFYNDSNYDFEDVSTGFGTANTANTWSGNVGTYRNPSGLG